MEVVRYRVGPYTFHKTLRTWLSGMRDHKADVGAGMAARTGRLHASLPNGIGPHIDDHNRDDRRMLLCNPLQGLAYGSLQVAVLQRPYRDAEGRTEPEPYPLSRSHVACR